MEELCREGQDHNRAALDGRQRLQVSEVEGHRGQSGPCLLQSTRRVHLSFSRDHLTNTKRGAVRSQDSRKRHNADTFKHKVTSVLVLVQEDTTMTMCVWPGSRFSHVSPRVRGPPPGKTRQRPPLMAPHLQSEPEQGEASEQKTDDTDTLCEIRLPTVPAYTSAYTHSSSTHHRAAADLLWLNVKGHGPQVHRLYDVQPGDEPDQTCRDGPLVVYRNYLQMSSPESCTE